MRCWELGPGQNEWMRCPILIGREGPVSLIAGAVRRLRGDAGGGALVVVGEAGVGKTRLAEYLSDAAARAGIEAVHGRALPEGVGGWLRPVAEMLLDLARDRAAPADAGLAPYVTVLASLVPRWRAPGWSAPAEPVVVTAEAVLQVLRWAAGDAGGNGMVVILEDLHWADDATLAVTRYLVDHASEVPALVFGTIRTGEGREDARALLEAGGAQVCPIGRLSQDEARDMAHACAVAGPSLDDTIAAVVRDAEGLPLLVEDLLATGDLGGVAPRFADTVRARLARLDDRQRTVVGAAAVLGRRFDWGLLEQTAGVQGADVTGALHRCAALQLVVADGSGFVFRHALTRDVILAELAGPERCRLSLAAAEALASAVGSNDDDHVLMTGRLLVDGGEPLRAAEVLLQASRRGLAAGSLTSAELFLREAGRAAEGSEDLSAEIACQLAQVLLHAGQLSEAARIASRMVTVTDGRDLAAATAMRLVLARAAVLTAAWDNARIQLADVRRGPPADQEAHAEGAVIEAQVALGDGRPGSRARAAYLAAAAAGIAREAPARPGLRGAGGARVLRPAARPRRGGGRLRPGTQPRGRSGPAGAPPEDPQRTRDRGDAARRAWRTPGTGPLRGVSRGCRRAGRRHRRQHRGADGDDRRFDDAMQVAGEVERTARRLGLIPLQAAALLMQGFAMAHQGRTREMEHYLAAAEVTAPDDPDLRPARGLSAAGSVPCSPKTAAAHARPSPAPARKPPTSMRGILNPYEGPELLLRALAAEAARPR